MGIDGHREGELEDSWQLPLICAANPVWCTDGATMAAHRSSWVEGRPIADDP